MHIGATCTPNPLLGLAVANIALDRHFSGAWAEDAEHAQVVGEQRVVVHGVVGVGHKGWVLVPHVQVVVGEHDDVQVVAVDKAQDD